MWAHLVLWVASVLVVAGQSSDVTQCIESYNWSYNAKGQTPCLVAAYLESACGRPVSVNAVPPGNHYTGPTFAESDECRCSTVTYSLISACGGCQDRSFSNWTSWTVNCPETFVTKFTKPIPDGTSVPNWAFFDVTLSGDNFDPTIAAKLAEPNMSSTGFTSGPPPSTPSTFSIPFTTLPSPTLTPTSPTASTSATPTHSTNAGAIAGGTVGGLVFVAIILLVILRWYMKRQRNAVQKDLIFDQNALFSGSSGYVQPPEPLMRNAGSPGTFSSRYHDTSELSTMPSSPMTSAVYTHLPGSTGRRSFESVTPSLAQFGAGATASSTSALRPNRGFRGAAEVA